MNLELT